MSKTHSDTSEDFEYIETPAAPTPVPPLEDCGVRTTAVSWDILYDLLGFGVLMEVQYPAIKNAPLPADAAGSESFSNALLFSLLAIVPWYLARQLRGGFWVILFLAPLTALPILVIFWTVASTISHRKNEKARYPGRPVQDYLHFRSEEDRVKYYGKNRIPMETFHEMYFDEKVDFKGDCLDVMEYRHDWASFRFTLSLFKFFFTAMIPEVILHTRSQGLSYVICWHLTKLTSSFR
jgi:sphingolipid C9-methyltransferase